jgi:hypothetical protein
MISQVPRAACAFFAPTRRAEMRLVPLAPGSRASSGFTTTPSGIRLATPEKALLDTLYLTPARSRLFAALPEVELPRGFSAREARRWVARIPKGPRRLAVQRRLAQVLAAAG